jgi:ribonuclease P protein component
MVERGLRLREEADVRRARSRGKSFADGPLLVRVLPNRSDPPRNRYAVVAGKRVGKAVQRNRLKRLVREAIRYAHPRLAVGHDVVVVVRGTVAELSGLEVAQASFARTMTRAGLLRPDGTAKPDGPPATASVSATPAAPALVESVAEKEQGQ